MPLLNEYVAVTFPEPRFVVPQVPSAERFLFAIFACRATVAARDTMTVAEILSEIEPYTGRFPKEALQDAVEKREAHYT